MLTIDGIQRYTPPPQLLAAAPPPQRAVPQGDGNFSNSVAGTKPQPDLDLALARMSNDAYAADNPKTEQALAEAGWTRLEANADGTALVGSDGREIAVDPALLSTDNGLDAAVYQNEQGQYVIAYRGTDDWGTTKGADLDDNAGQGLGFDSPQYRDALDLAREVELAVGDGNVITTGHSLGGGLASAAALHIGSSAVTFNASGLSNQTLESLGFNANGVRHSVADSGQIRRYAVDGDPLTAAQEDVPMIPILGVSPPDALGHALRVAPPAGLGFDLAALHGGGGDGASYVASLEQNTAYDREIVGTPFDQAGQAVDKGLDVAGDAAGRWLDGAGDTLQNVLTVAGTASQAVGGPGGWLAGAALQGAAPVVNGVADGIGRALDTGLDVAGNVLSPVIGTGGNIVRDVIHNVGELGINQLGDTARTLFDFGGEFAANASETVAGIKDAIATEFANGDIAAGTGRVIGDVLDGTIDTLGDAASGVVGLAGDTVQNLADAAGSGLRDLGDELGFAGIADPVASVVEGAGKAVSDVADRAGDVIETVTDAVGDVTEKVADVAGDVAQGVGDFLSRVNPFR